VRDRFKLPRGTLEYYGQSAGQACEELRLFLAKQRRRTWSVEERARVREAAGGDCAICGAALEAFEVDHIKPLSKGGADEPKNLQALCLTCHRQKSEHERVSGLAHRPLFSELQQDVLEGLVDSPKPQQIVYGVIDRPCVAFDAIGCRRNAMRHQQEPFPVACVLDELKAGYREDADFFFLDSGAGPKDEEELLRVAPYMGPAWYSRESARYLFELQLCRPEHCRCHFRASEHAPPDALRDV
jgi:hypothetical protein